MNASANDMNVDAIKMGEIKMNAYANKMDECKMQMINATLTND